MGKLLSLQQYSPYEDPLWGEKEPTLSFYEKFRRNLQECALDVCENEKGNKERWDSAYFQGGESTEVEIEEVRTELTDMVLQTAKDTHPHTFQQLITVVIKKTEGNKYPIAIFGNWRDALKIIKEEPSEVYIVSTNSIFSAPNKIRHRMRSCILDITPGNSN
jgi:hypothetical protein